MRISFSEAFSQTLTEFKITAKELAIKTGVKEATISEFRTGKSEARITTVEVLINALPEEARNYFYFKVLVSGINDRDISNLLHAIANELRAEKKELVSA